MVLRAELINYFASGTNYDYMRHFVLEWERNSLGGAQLVSSILFFFVVARETRSDGFHSMRMLLIFKWVHSLCAMWEVHAYAYSIFVTPKWVSTIPSTLRTRKSNTFKLIELNPFNSIVNNTISERLWRCVPHDDVHAYSNRRTHETQRLEYIQQ